MLRDFRYAVREFLKRPSIAITAIISLTLGIGASTAVFSVIYSFLANPYPYAGAHRMVHLRLIDDRGEERSSGVTRAHLADLRKLQCVDSVAGIWGTWNLPTTDEELPEDVPSDQVTGNAFVHFGVPALLGRTILPSDAPEGQDPQPVVVLSYLFWQRHFHSDPGVVGRRLQLVRKNYTIIGVLPPRFTWDDVDVYLPLEPSTNDPKITLGPLIRLKPGVKREAANAELQPLLEQWAKEAPDDYPKKFRVALKGFNDDFLRRVGPSLYLLGGAVALLLLIGCANVSILLLARGTTRQHEIALRSAIGASRWHIQRQLLVEALVLSLAGCAAGVLLAYRMLPLLIRWLPEYSIPHEAAIRINVPVLLFSIALATIMGALAGLAPAVQFSTPLLAQLMHSGSRRTTGGSRGKVTHQLLVGGQIALTLLLLTSSAAAVNGFVKLVRTDLGYDPHHTMSVGIPVHQHAHDTWEDRSAYFGRLLASVQAMPEVTAAGISSNATPPSNGRNAHIEVFGGSPNPQDMVRVNYISPEYFNVLRIPLAQGRLWDPAEMSRGARLAVIGRAAAKRYWPNGDVIGKKLRLPDQKASPPFLLMPKDADSWIEIIGVVADARDDGLRKSVAPQIYVPYTLTMWMNTQILVRTRTSPLSILDRVRAQVKAVDPDQQVFGQVRDLDQWIEREDEYQYGRLVAGIFSGLSLLALALAAFGLFSVVSYGVAQRTNEFGIRMALGATGAQLVALAFRTTAASVLGGVAAGIALTFACSKLLARWAQGSEQQPWTFAAAVLVLLLTAALAAFLPARRASAVDPMEALRYD